MRVCVYVCMCVCVLVRVRVRVYVYVCFIDIFSLGELNMKNPVYYYPNQKTTWKNAESFCVNWGGHLASILNKEENDFLIAEKKKR